MFGGLDISVMSMQDLDDMSRATLEAIWEHGGEATTSEIKEYTGYTGEDVNSKLAYRRRKHLEPGGLVESETRDEGDTLPVTVWRLTEKGEKRVQQILGDDETPPLSRRVEELRQIVGELKESVETFEGRLDHVEQQVEEGTVESETVENQVEDAQSEIDSRLRKIEARQDALLGLFELYELVNVRHVEEIGEKAASGTLHSSMSKMDYSKARTGSKAYKGGAVGSAAGTLLEGMDNNPLNKSSEQLAQEFEESEGNDESDTESDEDGGPSQTL